MAVRFDAAGEHYTAALTMGSTTARTIAFWAKLSVDRNDFSTFVCLDDGTTANAHAVETRADGQILDLFENLFSGVTSAPTLAVGTWYYVALTVSSGSATLRVRADGAGSWTTAGPTSGYLATLVTNRLLVGASTWGGTEWLNGCVTGLKVWSAALTVTELDAEFAAYRAVRTANLVAHYPLTSVTDLADRSGNGQASLTGGVGATTEAGPAAASPRPLTLDASSPASAYLSGDTVTTASFTPPAKSLIVVWCRYNTEFESGLADPTITDSLATDLPYTLHAHNRRPDGSIAAGALAVWSAPVTTSQPMTITVTDPSSINPGNAVKVQVWVDDSGGTPTIGAVLENSSTATRTAVAQAFTATANDSRGVMGFVDWDVVSPSASPTAGTGCTLTGGDSASQPSYSYACVLRSANDGVSGASTTMNLSHGSSANTRWITVEVVPGTTSPPATAAGQYGWGTYGAGDYGPNFGQAAAASAPAELASGTGSAYDATVSAAVAASSPAELAAGAGAAEQPSAAAAPNAGPADATGSAPQPSAAAGVPAGSAAGTGAAHDAGVAAAANTTTASGSGAALDAAASAAPSASPASGTGAAFDATVVTVPTVDAAAGLAAATGAAGDAAAAAGTPAGAAEGSGAAPDPQIAVAAAAGPATATGAALDPTVSTVPAVTADAQPATGTGQAYDVTALTAAAPQTPPADGTGSAYDAAAAAGVQPPPAAAAGSALDPSAAAAASAEPATATGSAFDATVSTFSSGTGPAEAAAGVGAALDATVSAAAAPPAGHAAGTGAAYDATVSTIPTASPAAGHASGTAAAGPATAAAGAQPDTASGAGAAFDATVSTLAATAAPTGLAAATGAAGDATASIRVEAGPAEAFGAAYDPEVVAVAATSPAAGVAEAFGAAFDAQVHIVVFAPAAAGAGAAYDPDLALASEIVAFAVVDAGRAGLVTADQGAAGMTGEDRGGRAELVTADSGPGRVATADAGRAAAIGGVG